MNKDMLVLKGKTVFIATLVIIGLTILTVYSSGINYNRSLSANLYISLSVISAVIFTFLSIALYKGTQLVNDYPKFKNFQPGMWFSDSNIPEVGDIDIDEGIGGCLFSILSWIVMSIVMVVLLIVFEAIFWISLFLIFASLYWIFIRALKLAVKKSVATKGDLSASVLNSLGYTLLYTGWLFAIALIVDLVK
ncbi:hypothetical protein LVD15_23020 [Fulvivirga maritima]|uniref:hypothetical protein n=1 Tax=Fulvivirga maritima TaxID=2904247 RepID=UPI001F2CB4E1|nr:hypothetical protein [Fulvivirga maritima]UII26142.1 hypothetical protein LVD15_23020 [Fulvivirga maritima]